MKTQVRLDKEDIRQIIAERYGVKTSEVDVCCEMKYVGYGMNEHEVPFVEATVSLDKAVRL